MSGARLKHYGWGREDEGMTAEEQRKGDFVCAKCRWTAAEVGRGHLCPECESPMEFATPCRKCQAEAWGEVPEPKRFEDVDMVTWDRIDAGSGNFSQHGEPVIQETNTEINIGQVVI